MWRISADTGGTFTDCFAVRPDGKEVRCKVLSAGCLRSRIVEVVDRCRVRLSDDWATGDGLLNGFRAQLVESRIVTGWKSATRTLELSDDIPESWCAGSVIELRTGEEAPVLGARLLTGTPLGRAFPPMQFRVATTRATNALLERKGSRVALFITQGFGDLPLIGDQRRADLFALRHTPRAQFHEMVFEVKGRLDAQGSELEPLDETGVRDAALKFIGEGITHAAVALLHSHANADHERRVATLLRDADFEHVSVSSELAPFVKLLPRAQSAIANAYLTGPVQSFLVGVAKPLGKASLQVMTSAGGLESAQSIKPKDMLLSGPAGGAIGAANAARRMGHTKIITFDMGGTSTDVARIDGRPGYKFTQSIEGMNLLAPCVAIETVAAGGGSICAWTASGLAVGPHSAGSSPGPACYGKGGPLTITDVNLLLGRFDPSRAPIPLDVAAAESRLSELLGIVNRESSFSRESLLAALHDLAVEHMADAIRRISVSEGYDPRGYALLAFGGAGPQHACAVAAKLGMTAILVPKHAGILSAVGLHEAVPEAVVEKQVLLPLAEASSNVDAWCAAMIADSAIGGGTITRLAELRLRGQDTPLQVEFQNADELAACYSAAYERLFGYAPPADRVVELVSLRVIVKASGEPGDGRSKMENGVEHGALVAMRLIQDAFSTLVVEPGWAVRDVDPFGYVLESAPSPISNLPSPAASASLMRHRFHSLVDDMGALLKRTSISTNIRERLDFSCALLDAKGVLIASAPHIPVHLGALGVCVRETMKQFTPIAGDTFITNHPAFGGSHLPDVTLITPVFDAANELLGFVANRAHHAEIGGITPGSMPATASSLIEEGVVIAPRYLVRAGETLFDEAATLLTTAPYPTRNLADNLADLHAQLAANRLGVERLQQLASANDVRASMQSILDHSAKVMRARLPTIPDAEAEQTLDDGSLIKLRIRHQAANLQIDFTGTSSTHPRNLNATTAIVNSAVLYVLRLMLQEDLPLNEGLMQPIELVLPTGTMLNPIFTGDASRDPAVVGGNVEVSQRVVDTLIKALHLQACSQGTMNNTLFGNERFGYYETIAGGAGAGEGYDGASALHTHMTNTAITDPEIVEQRYPVRLRQFAIRRGSGGAGRWHGGDGVVREFEFLEPLTVSLLTQHRASGAYGMDGGGDGLPGKQTLHRADGSSEVLAASASLRVNAGDRLVMETPGGGGYGVI
jgi:5-oxoprolinase (ATP-hydrolysing)